MSNRNLNLFFLTHLLTVLLVGFGALDRAWILPWAGVVLIFIARVNLAAGTSFFVRSLPLFVALPLTSYFDSFNLWRLVSAVLFIKWLLSADSPYQAWRRLDWQKLKKFLNPNRRSLTITFFWLLFLFSALLSLTQSADLMIGFKRIIYLVNLWLIIPVIYGLVKNQSWFFPRILKDLVIAGLIAVILGLGQLITAYLGSIYAFMNFWGEVVQRNFFGQEWAEIAVQQNTWFAYFGDYLSLRVFSIFPDSHSFPVFVLLSLPALLALAWQRKRFWSPLLFLAPLFLLLVILSGTRGVWLTVLAPLVLTLGGWIWFKKQDLKRLARWHLAPLTAFVLLFSAALPIFGSSQFQVNKAEGQLLLKRFRSTFNLVETSNHGRLEIWRLTLDSITQKPWLGVGIGNFPVVLSQAPEWARAGSSAHNLYLNIAAETGIGGMLTIVAIFWLVIKKGWRLLVQDRYSLERVYGAGFLLFLSWVLFYNFTDAILFDERAFLILAVNGATAVGLSQRLKDLNQTKSG